jgi:hypothetical protein
VFSWTPTLDQAPGSYPITITVTDDGLPPLSDRQTFTATVQDYLSVRVGQQVMQAGHTAPLPIEIDARGIDRLTFVLRFDRSRFDDLADAALEPVDADRVHVTLQAREGRAIHGVDEFARLILTAAQDQSSAFIHVHIEDLSGRTHEFVADPPILHIDRDSADTVPILVFGKPGTRAALQSADTLEPDTVWTTVAEFEFADSFHEINVALGDRMTFFRAQVQD